MWSPRSPTGNTSRGFGFIHGCFGVINTCFCGKCCNSRSSRPLGFGYTALPAVHRSKRNAKSVRELLLSEVKPGANGLQGGGNRWKVLLYLP